MFGSTPSEGNYQMYSLLGNKGANLAELSNLGIAVPPGFTIPSTVCQQYYKNNKCFSQEIKAAVISAISQLEQITNKKFGDLYNPLLLSVRSGAACSMPGMMDTILNLGLNTQIIKNWNPDNARSAYDCYRRFIQMYGSIVLDIEISKFNEIFEEYKSRAGAKVDSEISAEVLQVIITKFHELLHSHNLFIPEDVNDQLFNAIEAVIRSWMNERAIAYRRLHNISTELGTAVNIQAMVFGNINNQSGSGVVFTRNPSTGENKIFGEFLLNAQGEDIVAGVRTPFPIEDLKIKMPSIYNQLTSIGKILENHYTDLQDIEFTIQDNSLWILQTRTAKRSTEASIKIAIDMTEEGLITKEKAIMRISPSSLTNLLHATIDETKIIKVIAKGLPASPGAATGAVVFSTEEALKAVNNNQKVILVRSETSPEDIEGMSLAEGIITARGGMTSHAAVVARGIGKPCICGATDITINYVEGYLVTSQGLKINYGDYITIDGTTGRIILGNVSKICTVLSSHFSKFMQWVDEKSNFKIRANADNVQDIKTAKNFGASGVGLCRTEHMFFSKERTELVRKLIITNNGPEKHSFLKKLEKIQSDDFLSMFKEIETLPITIRLLDPPLHEFLPHNKEVIDEFIKNSGFPYNFVYKRLEELKEVNPMIGHRGCRLGITDPEIYDMQVRAIFSAATQSKNLLGYPPNLEILIPFIIKPTEIEYIKKRIIQIAKNYNLPYIIGSMIEIPSAALNADKIAVYCDFFSFGTNDLTQTTLGLSRDDCNSFMRSYQENNIISQDPFLYIDEAVGELMQIAVERGKTANPNLKVGVCGEQGGNPFSIPFLSKLGANYISCSPYRIPIAKLSAAQQAINTAITPPLSSC